MSDTRQPTWELVANLGDANVADYGGFLVYRDTTGVYPPEVELYDANDDETGGTMYRFILYPPRFRTFIHGLGHDPKVIKDNSQRGITWNFSREWFADADKLRSAASTCGVKPFSLLRDLASNDPIKRAFGYQTLIATFGAFEFDQYPITLTEDEAHARYSGVKVAA